jgi:hypothetical protein
MNEKKVLQKKKIGEQVFEMPEKEVKSARHLMVNSEREKSDFGYLIGMKMNL